MTAAPIISPTLASGGTRSPPHPLGQSPLAAVGYIRVSREEQVRNGVSLDAQRARIVAYANAKDLELTAVYSDEGLSGKELARPGLHQLLEHCKRGRIRHVIVWKLDRLTRRTRHLLGLVEDLFVHRKIELHSVSESLDTATPHGRFVLTLFGGLAQMEREQIAERTRGALAWKREQGLPTSHPPLGFRSMGKREPMKPVVAELRVVRRILGLREAGMGYRAIAAALNSERVPTKRSARWHHTTVAKVIGARQRYRFVFAEASSLDTPERACPPRGAAKLTSAEVEGTPRQGRGDSPPPTCGAALHATATACPSRPRSTSTKEGGVGGTLPRKRGVPHHENHKNHNRIGSRPRSGTRGASRHPRVAHRQ